MSIIKKPDPKHDTTTEYTFDPRKDDFRLTAIPIKGVEHDRISRAQIDMCIHLAPGRLIYDQNLIPNQNAPQFCPLGTSKDNGTQEILIRFETTFHQKLDCL